MSTDRSYIRAIFSNFDIPKAARIWPGNDIRIENYRGSKIVDLSSTIFLCLGWSKFQFEFFYKETVYGVFDWFKDCQNCLCQYHQDLFPGPLPLCFEPPIPELVSGGGAGAATLPGMFCTGF